jgi:hypothetical protein
MRRMGLAGVALAAAFLTMVCGASAATLCVKESANGAVKGPTTVHGNACKSGYEKIELPPAAELETLTKVLSHVKYEEKGIGGKPTIQFSGVDVQVVNGEGNTATTNGEGNLVIGYDENVGKHGQTGSHNLILGEEQTFTSYGGILGGRDNTISGPYASVSGGEGNVASGKDASVSGGFANTASGETAWVTGGEGNTASGLSASADGGYRNTASGGNTLASGGSGNVSEGNATSTSGGKLNKASGPAASVSGGEENAAQRQRGLGEWR